MRARSIDLGCATQLFDVTSYDSRQKPIPTDDFDFLIFGFPVFSDFAPIVINDWLRSLKGNQKRCAMFFTYGARTTGYAHFHTKMLLEKVGFIVVLSGEFLGRHSFNVGGWRILPDRPNQEDFSVARTYVDCALDRFKQNNLGVFNLQKPFAYNHAVRSLLKKKDKDEDDWLHPVRITDDCCMCCDCETECPTQAFDAKLGDSDLEKCIECMRCVYICPDQVIKIDPRMEEAYSNFLDYWHLTEEMMNAKKSKIIQESWQAAS
jgi:NAD-dependent dihydropyrimidine dehydrogenase PreA subunit